jgi:hypothetical protein
VKENKQKAPELIGGVMNKNLEMVAHVALAYYLLNSLLRNSHCPSLSMSVAANHPKANF